MKGNKFTYALSIIEIIGLISMIFIHNNVIRIAIFIFLMPISLINAQIKKQMYSDNKNLRMRTIKIQLILKKSSFNKLFFFYLIRIL